jgi:hypothetical protein
MAMSKVSEHCVSLLDKAGYKIKSKFDFSTDGTMLTKKVAPSHNKVGTWLRKKHGIHVTVRRRLWFEGGIITVEWSDYVYVKDSNECLPETLGNEFTFYEEALESGIETALSYITRGFKLMDLEPVSTFEQFVKKWHNDVKPNRSKELREGQALMVFLHDTWSEEYKRISSVHYYDKNDMDCFYNDKLIPNTLTHLEREWKTYPF